MVDKIISKIDIQEMTKDNIHRRRIELFNKVINRIIENAQRGNDGMVMLAPCNPAFGRGSIYFREDDRDWLIHKLESNGFVVQLKKSDDSEYCSCEDIWIYW